MKVKPIAIGGDIFAGLFTLGIKQAGFDVRAHLEHTDYGAATAALNFPKLDLRLNGPENWDLRTLPKTPDLFYSNPPCAPWSNWNSSSAGWRDDERIKWVDDLIGAALALKTKTFIWESVPSTWGKGRPFVLDKARRFLEAKYHVTVLLQNNMYLGAPQNRKRMMLVAHKHPLVWPKFVEPKSTKDWFEELGELYAKKAQSVSQAEISPWEVRVWKRSAKFKGSFKLAIESFSETVQEKNPRFSYMACRVPLDRPPNLITGHRYHPTEPRRLSYSELLILCGMTPTWKTACSRRGGDNGDANGELLRAVLPPVGKWVGKAVRTGLGKEKLNVRHRSIRLYDARKPNAIVDAPIELTTEGLDLRPEASKDDERVRAIDRDEAPKPTRSDQGSDEKPRGVSRRRRVRREDLPDDDRSQRSARSKPSAKRSSEDGTWKTSKDLITVRCKQKGYDATNRPPKDWAEKIAEEVRSVFVGRTTKASDVYFVWRRL